MKTSIFLVLFFLAPVGLLAQLNFNTGSSELDADLKIINSDAKADMSSFKTDLSVEFKVSTKKIDQMLSMKMEPGEVYLALEIAKIAKREIDDVLKVYKANKDKGWGYIAKQMGIKPGSPEFHALKGDSKNKSAKGKSNKSNGKGNSSGQSKGNSGKSKGQGKKK